MYQVKGFEKKKNQYVVTINCDGVEKTFNVSDELILEFRLVAGKIIEDKRFQQFLNALNYDKYRQKLLHYCHFKPRTKYEARLYLSQFDLSEKEIVTLIDKLVEMKLLDDMRYVKAYIQEYGQFRLVGPRKILFDLKQKGIEENDILSCLKMYSESQMRLNIVKLIQKKLKSSKNKSLQKMKSSLLEYVVHKGYDYSMVQSVIESQLDHIIYSNDENEALQKDFEEYLRKYKKSNQSQSLKAYCLPKLMQKGYGYHKILSLLEGEMNENQ